MLFSYQRAVGLACVAMFLFLILSITILPANTLDILPFKLSSHNHQADSSDSSQPWTFQVPRDARNYGLSPEQCDASFPELGFALNRSVNHRKKVGNITSQDLDIGWRTDGIVRAMIYEGQVYVIEAKGCHRRDYRERSLAVLQSIWRAVTAWPGPLPNIEFTFTVDDGAYDQGISEDRPPVTWSFTRKSDAIHNNLWLMADFGFYVWGATGEYSALLKSIEAAELPFDKKDPRAAWRGGNLKDRNIIRESLINATRDQPWADVEFFDWEKGKDGPTNWMPISRTCNYQFPVHTAGRTYSGRLKYLLNCHSVSVIHKLEWEENFHHLLVPTGPEQNFILVKRDFSDMKNKIEYYLAHPDKAQRIADNSVKVFRDRYLTPAAQACYWRKLFTSWHEVSFEPEFYITTGEKHRLELARAGNDENAKKRIEHKYQGTVESDLVPRGMPYEEYTLIETYEDSPW